MEYNIVHFSESLENEGYPQISPILADEREATPIVSAQRPFSSSLRKSA